jgi:ribosomal protein L12E/L44/L45/RPP1/RPP2
VERELNSQLLKKKKVRKPPSKLTMRPFFFPSPLDCCNAFRHVARTGDIKNFAVTTEASIAKGIRRIIAVTGEQAAQVSLFAALTRSCDRQLWPQPSSLRADFFSILFYFFSKQAQRVADALAVRLGVLPKLQGKELEEAIKVLTKDVDAAEISASRRNDFRGLLDQARKIFDEADKAKKAAEAKEVIDLEILFFLFLLIHHLFILGMNYAGARSGQGRGGEEPQRRLYRRSSQRWLKRKGTFVVLFFFFPCRAEFFCHVCVCPKALTAATNQVRTLKKAGYFLSVEEGKVTHVCVVPKVC